jgi:hypothetical protein
MAWVGASVLSAATGCAYQDDDAWKEAEKACSGVTWSDDGWDGTALPDALSASDGCQAVLAEHTGAEAIKSVDWATRDAVVWAAWTLAFKPMKQPSVAPDASQVSQIWEEDGQAGLYEAVVQRLSDANASEQVRHSLDKGRWVAVRDPAPMALALPQMVHASQHYSGKDHATCESGGSEACDANWDGPNGWTAGVLGLLVGGEVDESTTALELFLVDEVVDAAQGVNGGGGDTSGGGGDSGYDTGVIEALR